MEELSLGIALRKTGWHRLPGSPAFTARTLEETLVGGQAFRWFWIPDGNYWLGIWEQHVAAVRLAANGTLQAAPLAHGTSLDCLQGYLGLDRLPGLVDALPIPSDPVLADLYQRWSSLSILRQPPGETLLTFICSSNKRILQIRAMLEALAARFGERIPGTPFHALPSWEALSRVSERALRECGLGYRAAHVRGTARYLADNPGFLDAISRLPYAEAFVSLRTLPGVGPKVADCILLFAYGQTAAFPVDTWIEKILKIRYPELASWNRTQLAAFARIHFGKAAGLAQQWFFGERAELLPISAKRQVARACQFQLDPGINPELPASS